MPPARGAPPAPVAPAASESSPALPPSVAEAQPDTAEAGARVREAVEDHAEEPIGAESVEEPEVEDPEEGEEEDPEEAEEEDPEEAEVEDPEDEADGGKGNEVETVLALGQGDGLAAGAESEKTVTMEGGDGEKAMTVEDGGGEDAGLQSAVVEEPAQEDEGQEQAGEDDAMEEDATVGSGEGAAVDGMDELPEDHKESGDEGSHGDTDKDGAACQLSVHCEAQNGELDPSVAMLGSVSVGNVKDLEIFVGGLPKDCTEEDITAVFSHFGEIVSIKINPSAKKRTRNAFVRYTSTEAAKKALAEFKDGVEVTGKRVKVATSRVKNTLYLTNICKSWTKEQVVLSLKSIGIEEFEISLPDDPDTEGQNIGISFLKFAATDTAESAFQKLQQPDALIDIDRSVKEYAPTPTESGQELAMKVKAVYLEHVPLTWDEGNIKECCISYGEIQDVRLLKKSKKKISFVEFSSRTSALACVEGINSAKIGGEVKLAASLARPRRKIHLDKSAKGALKVNGGAASEDANNSIKIKDQKKEVMLEKSSHKLPKGDVEIHLDKSAKGALKVNGGAASEDANNSIKKKDQKKEVMLKKRSHKLRKGDVSKLTSQVDEEVPQASNLYKGKRKAGKTENTAVNERLLKKGRKNRDVQTRPSNRARHGGYARAAYAGESSGNMKRSVGSRYLTMNEACPIAGTSSRSKANARDLEPHAGYIPPVNRVRTPTDRVQVTYLYDQPRAAPSNYHHIDVLPYTREIAAPPPVYSGYTSNHQYQGEYAYTYLPPPHLSGADYPRSREYSPRRRYY